LRRRQTFEQGALLRKDFALKADQTLDDFLHGVLQDRRISLQCPRRAARSLQAAYSRDYTAAGYWSTTHARTATMCRRHPAFIRLAR
jgi:hypothetical protein